MKSSFRRAESILMRFLSRLGFEGLSWAARRLYCPVLSDGLVLEVGSGGNPYFRSNVLLDAYEDTCERHWAPLVTDRPTVLGFVEYLPFRDNAFDFVIASHVFEHSTDPTRFLNELQRVAKAGYIEVPDAFMERVNPYRDHRLEITVRNGRLLIRKKASCKVDSELVELYEEHIKPILTQETMRNHPFEFHVRYYWEGSINYEVLNPEVDANWSVLASERSEVTSLGIRQCVGQVVLKWIRYAFSQRRRNANFDLTSVLACPHCNSVELAIIDDKINCDNCGRSYFVRNGIPVMRPSNVRTMK